MSSHKRRKEVLLRLLTTEWSKGKPLEVVFEYAKRLSRINNANCLLCGVGKVKFCHIIPVRFGGGKQLWNILYLCKQHHLDFDNKRLMEKDKEKLRPYIEKALLKQLKRNEMIKCGKRKGKICLLKKYEKWLQKTYKYFKIGVSP